MREDVYATQQADGRYFRQNTALTSGDLKEHLSGEKTLGIYFNADAAKLTCIDFDTKDAYSVLEVYQKAYSLAPNATLFEESGRKGFHIWVFLEPTELWKARKLGLHLTKDLDFDVEVYPRQNELSETKPYGNPVKLPLGKHRRGDWSRFINGSFYHVKPLKLMKGIYPKKIDDLDIDIGRKPKRRRHQKKKIHSDYPCIRYINDRGFADGEGRNDAALRIAGYYLNEKNIDEVVIKSFLTAWNSFNNPPLPLGELWRTYESALNEGYTFSCQSMGAYCGPEEKKQCPIYQRKKAAEEDDKNTRQAKGRRIR